MDHDAECGICGAALIGPRMHHAEPWCKSWTYHIAVGDALPIRWLTDYRGRRIR